MMTRILYWLALARFSNAELERYEKPSKPVLMPFIARQKFYFDIGGSIIQVGTFALVLSDKLQLLTGIGQTRYLMVMGAFIGVAAVWLMGWILDRFNYMEHYKREENGRNELFRKLGDEHGK